MFIYLSSFPFPSIGLWGVLKDGILQLIRDCFLTLTNVGIDWLRVYKEIDKKTNGGNHHTNDKREGHRKAKRCAACKNQRRERASPSHGIRKYGGWQVSRGGYLQAECIIAIQPHKKLDASKVDTWLNSYSNSQGGKHVMWRRIKSIKLTKKNLNPESKGRERERERERRVTEEWPPKPRQCPKVKGMRRQLPKSKPRA